MSMLAESRRKTKWVINPTKKPLWITTESNGIKFGRELMEKMGWSAGKGLGAKEQGIQEPLKVSYKNDTKGMGFKGNDDDWIEQQDEFNVLLNQLRNSDDSSVVKVSEEKNEIKSLEEKSKQSRARVHYQKFTRGKDLSRYSENDLACILGTNKIKKEKSKTEEVVESEEKDEGGLVTSFGVTTINSGSIQDYFKRKWITNKPQSKSVPEVEKEKEEYSCDERPSFSRVFEDNKDFSEKENKKEDGVLDGNEMNGDSGEKCEKRKKRKKKDVQTCEEEEPKSKRKKTSDQDNPEDEELHNLPGVASDEMKTENLVECENNCDSSRKRKKEKRKSKKDERHDGSEETDNVEVKKRKKKERKEKPVENGYCDTEILASIDCSLEAECPEKEVKKRKKRKTENEVIGEVKKENIEETDLEVSVGEINAVVEGEDVVVAKGKEKKKHKDCGGNVRVDESIEKNELGKVSSVCENEAGSKKKKKKKEKQEEMECCSNENGISCEIQAEKCDSGSNSNSTTDLEVKKKKKKKGEPEGEKVECFGNESGPSSYAKCDGDNNTVELEGIKKKKKKEKQEGKKEECSSNGNEIQVENCDNGSNSNSTVELEEIKKKRKKKEKQEGDKVECSGNGNEISNEIQVEKCDNGSSSNGIAELGEVKKKKKKKEKQEDKKECYNNESEVLSEIPVGKCDDGSNSNSLTELEETKKKRKKKEKQEGDKVEYSGNGNEISNEIQMEKCDSNSTAELEVKKKKKKKEKQEDKKECYDIENKPSSDIPKGKCDNGNNSNSTEELEVKKKKKKDKHKTKEENSSSNHIGESCLDNAHQEDINGLSEMVEKKKKKDKKEKHKSRDESLNKESKEPCPDEESTNVEMGCNMKRMEKKAKSEGAKAEGGEKEAKAVESAKGNAEIGTTAGIDRVEMISQRAAYEHVAGQHRYERIQKMIGFVNLDRFRGSNLECLDGYGNSLRKCKPSDR